MRRPENRHLGEIVPSEVQQVSSSYFLNEFNRTLNSATVCRCEENAASSSSTTCAMSDASQVNGNGAGDNSPVMHHGHSHAIHEARGEK
ncbi:hypothetical protein KIN20_015097, partial [Parelaphostrongylus tenuis]